MWRLLIAALLSAPSAAQRCLPEYACSFRHHFGRSRAVYEFNLGRLCKDGPYRTNPPSAVGTAATDYVWTTNGGTGQNFTFNICGSASAVCSFNAKSPQYDSRGTVVQVRGAGQLPDMHCSPAKDLWVPLNPAL
jgi:hypothetical protein